MTEKKDVYRIAITADTQVALWALRPAFEGHLDVDDPTRLTDDHLVATLLGWHLRRKPGRIGAWGLKDALNEFEFRAAEDLDADWPDAELRRATQMRSTKSTPGYVLTIDGIDKRTPERIIARAQAVESILKKLEVMEVRAAQRGEEESVALQFVQYSDQAIIDLCTYLFIQRWESDKLEDFPTWALEEIVRRGENPGLTVKSEPIDLAGEITAQKRKVARAFDDIQTPNPGAISTFREFENDVRSICSEIGLGAIPRPTTEPVSVLTSPTVNEAIELLAAGKRVPSETYVRSLVPLESSRPKIEELAARRAAEGLITILIARMIEANDLHVLAITSENENSGPYVTTSRLRDGLVDVSFVSNFTRLENNEREISVLLTILGWTAQPLPSSTVIVYSKAWREDVPPVEVGVDVALALVYVLYVARYLPSWFYTTLTNDSLIEELANSLPIKRFDSDETHAKSDIANAQTNTVFREKIRFDASTERPRAHNAAAEAASAGSPYREEIRDNYLSNLSTKLERRIMQHLKQQPEIEKLLNLFPKPEL